MFNTQISYVGLAILSTDAVILVSLTLIYYQVMINQLVALVDIHLHRVSKNCANIYKLLTYWRRHTSKAVYENGIMTAAPFSCTCRQAELVSRSSLGVQIARDKAYILPVDNKVQIYS